MFYLNLSQDLTTTDIANNADINDAKVITAVP